MYKKRGTYLDLEGYVQEKTGLSIDELNKQKCYAMDKIPYIAEMIIKYIRKNAYIMVYTDYDADGMTSAAIFNLLLYNLGAKNYHVYVPRRFYDGYGLSMNFVEKCIGSSSEGLLITVDNGIAAINEIQKARQAGWDVIIMDHHLASKGDNGIIIPEASLIVDPHAIIDGNDFGEYCGAGLSYKLSKYMLGNSEVMNQIVALAAIGTVCDSVDVKGDNRQIIKDGLRAINNGQITAGLNALVTTYELSGHVTAKDLGFTIGPTINAVSRIFDSGAQDVAQAIVSGDLAASIPYAAYMKEINQYRKDITAQAIDNVKIKDGNVCFVDVEAGAGILGLIAARLVSINNKPTFVFTEKDGICKGSARSNNDLNNIKEMLDTCRSLLLSYGGHAGAAGFSFKAENKEEIRKSLDRYPIKNVPAADEYDLKISSNDILPTISIMDKIQPFGQGLEEPVFNVVCHFDPNRLNYWRSVGQNGDSLMFTITDDIKGIAFHAKKDYMDMKCPRDVNMIGTIAWNWYKGKASPQIMIEKIEKLS